jgi:hypothetical protein
MTWRWLRRRVDVPAADPSVLRAAEESKQRLVEAQEQTGEVERMARMLREMRVRNNFAAMVKAAFGEHR